MTDGSDQLYALLYSFYSYPNIVLPFVCGALTDRMGFWNAGILWTGLIAIG